VNELLDDLPDVIFIFLDKNGVNSLFLPPPLNSLRLEVEFRKYFFDGILYSSRYLFLNGRRLTAFFATGPFEQFCATLPNVC